MIGIPLTLMFMSCLGEQELIEHEEAFSSCLFVYGTRMHN